ncbi:kelch-like protein 3 [Montipora capricornis]|uniref:kelch-like protein 3 n=1 Tax=Montipora capricornis TaxID=246305 RepID=UPI0035F1FE0D
MEDLSQTIKNISSLKLAFTPRDTVDHPFDVTLVVKDEKELKAHKNVLSEGSPFFEKLLNCDMRESKEGIVRLEMLTEECLTAILEFIYTGSVEISTEERAQDLIAMADYLVLANLKTVAGKVLCNKLNSSNAISTYHFAEKFECGELVSRTKSFIFENFLAITKTEDFAKLSKEEVKMWIASDDIGVSAEEDVFEIILSWIDDDKIERRNYFAELFDKVRLVYVSRDYLRCNIMTNYLVNDNKECLNLVKNALQCAGTKTPHYLIRPRKALETPVIVVCVAGFTKEENVLCYYFPQENRWVRAQSSASIPAFTSGIVSCHGMLYCLSKEGKSLSLVCYDSFLDSWKTTSYEEFRTLISVFVTNETIYTLLSEDIVCCPECVSLRSQGDKLCCDKTHLSFIAKYSPQSDSWTDIASFDLKSRSAICIVATDNYIYFVGGYADDRFEVLREVDRYDLNTKSWEKIADLQVPRWYAHGAAAHRNIFIVGGVDRYSGPENCEMYDASANEWHFIAKLRKTPFDHYNPCLLGVDDKLYSIIRCICTFNRKDGIDFYDHDRDKWIEKTQMPLEKLFPKGLNGISYINVTFCCAIRVLKQSKFVKRAKFVEDCSKVDEHKCLIM